MTREEFDIFKSTHELPAIQVSPSESDDESEWLCTLSGDPEIVRFMVEDMSSTGGSCWEMGDDGDGFAYCLANDNGLGFYEITNEIEFDGFQWEEGA